MLNPNNCARTLHAWIQPAIVSKPVLPEDICFVCTVQTIMAPQKEGVEVGGNRKGPIMGLINFITDKQHKQLRFYGWG